MHNDEAPKIICVFQVKNWVKELRKILGDDICLCIVGKPEVSLNAMAMKVCICKYYNCKLK